MMYLRKCDVRDLVAEAVRARMAAGSEVDVRVKNLPAIGAILDWGGEVGDVAFDLYSEGHGPYRVTISMPRTEKKS